METVEFTGSSSSGAGSAASGKKQGFWGLVKKFAKEVFGQVFSWGFWARLGKRAIKTAAAAGIEAGLTAVGHVVIEAAGKVKRAMGFEEGDQAFKSTSQSQQPQTSYASSVFNQPQFATGGVGRTFAQTPGYPPARSELGGFPGFPSR